MLSEVFSRSEGRVHQESSDLGSSVYFFLLFITILKEKGGRERQRETERDRERLTERESARKGKKRETDRQRQRDRKGIGREC